MLSKRDIRKSKWCEEVSEYFDLDHNLLRSAVPRKRLKTEDMPKKIKEARDTLCKMFMSSESAKLYNKILTCHPDQITDTERSNSWKDYIFVCINGERRSFQRMHFYDQIIKCVIKPVLEWKENLVVLDYGCGSSLFTRMLSQDFGGCIKTISADVCKYAVEFSEARNKLYNPNASGIIIEDVLSFPELNKIDLILAFAVFEHLPNSTYQIQGLIDSFSPGGILIENYSGYSTEKPHKSDTFSAYKLRDRNLDLLENQMVLLYGRMPKKKYDVYERDSGNRFWIKEGVNIELISKIRRRLHRYNSCLQRVFGAINRFVIR